MNESKQVIILGAGLAGLTAAYELGLAGYQVTLLEAESEAGGLANAIQIEGHSIEKYYHFICRGDQYLVNFVRRLGIEDQLVWSPTHTSFFYNGRMFPFGTPFDLINFTAIPFMQRIRFGLHVLRSRYRNKWEELDKTEAVKWLKSNLGEKAYEVIWYPLLQVKFGDYHQRIAAAWMWHRIWRVARSRAWLLGKESYGYFKEGSYTLYSAILNALLKMPNVNIRFNSPAQSILTESNHVVGVQVEGQTIRCPNVISTIAIPQLLSLLPKIEDPFFENIRKIQMIGVVCMVLSLEKSFTRNFWLNINDPNIPYNGVIELTNLNAELKQAGLNILYIPFYLSTQSERYHYSDQKLFDEYMQTLKAIKPDFDPQQVKECFVFHSPYAQAICETGFSKLIPTTRCPVKGLYISDSTQFYPEDRTLSAAIHYGQQAAEFLMEDQK